MAVLVLSGIEKGFAGRRVLSGIALSFADGEFVSLLGPSGCGKTTLLRIIAGFERADQGAVLIDGRDVSALAPDRRKMGMVFQAYSLFPNMTAFENVRFGPRMQGRSLTEQKERAAELLALVGLEPHRDKYPHQLSGGQQQRVALARALAVRPAVLLLDEPLSALDAKVRVQLREEIRRIQRETGTTTVFVTHDQEEALSISDRVAVMHEGTLRQVAVPAVLYREPADAFVARFIGAGAVLAGRAEAQGVRVGAALLPASAAAAIAPGGEVELFLRPEHIRLASDAGTATAAGLPAAVADLTFLGSFTRVRLTLDGAGVTVAADLPSGEADRLTPGARVFAWWDAASPRILPR